uniref:Uncharacterized protein n=1 Tax=Schistocephalus solidus TaxID=70667 RepID=A0A0V0JBD8_SCHSO
MRVNAVVHKMGVYTQATDIADVPGQVIEEQHFTEGYVGLFLQFLEMLYLARRVDFQIVEQIVPGIHVQKLARNLWTGSSASKCDHAVAEARRRKLWLLFKMTGNVAKPVGQLVLLSRPSHNLESICTAYDER